MTFDVIQNLVKKTLPPFSSCEIQKEKLGGDGSIKIKVQSHTDSKSKTCNLGDLKFNLTQKGVQ